MIKKYVVLSLCILVISLTGCLYARKEPPPPPQVNNANPWLIAMRPEYTSVWIPGHWKWQGSKEGYVWVSGRWKHTK